MHKRILITGANAGLGKEAARQLAMKNGVEKIYLGCRNAYKAEVAKKELQKLTGRDIFEVLIIDVANLDSVDAAVLSLEKPLDALIMNAGGTGGVNFSNKTLQGVTQIVAVNLLGHVHLTKKLLEQGKLLNTAVYAGSEAARGVPEMGMKRPKLMSSSIKEFTRICNGEFFSKSQDAAEHYGYVKYMAALWMSAMARQYPQVRFVTMSPGATTGTEGFDTLPTLKKVAMKTMMTFMLLIGKVHKPEYGAKRYIDALFDSSYESGGFYASNKGLTGAVGKQEYLFADVGNESIQENATKAIEMFL